MISTPQIFYDFIPTYLIHFNIDMIYNWGRPKNYLTCLDISINTHCMQNHNRPYHKSQLLSSMSQL